MKHTLKITLMLVAIFLFSQVIGLFLINETVPHFTVNEMNETVKVEPSIVLDVPQEESDYAFVPILLAVLLGTVIVIILIRFRQIKIWKGWFFLSVFITLTVSFFIIFRKLFEMLDLDRIIADYSFFVVPYISTSLITAIILAFVLAVIKIYRPNIIVHNFTELFIYGGIAVIFVPMLNVFAVIALLILISIYDMYAVWKSKHMVKMANFQTDSKVFAGLLINYKLPNRSEHVHHVPSTHKQVETKNAVLGGGDVAFPLLFAGVMMKNLMLTYPVANGFVLSLVIPVTAAMGLFGLLYFAKKDRFYPAMPFITAGCLLGYLVLLPLL